MSWTIPNVLSVIRVLAAPCVALAFALFERPDADRIAIIIFVGAALTDYLDGILARSLSQESAFGRMLDPIADKAMVLIALAIIMSIYGLSWQIVLPAVLIILREVLVSGLREYLGAVKLHVTRMAKWKTTLQMLATGLLLLSGAVKPGEEAEPVNRAVESVLSYAAIGLGAIGLVLLWIAAWFTLVTGWDYFSKGMPYIRSKQSVTVTPVADPKE